MCCLEFPACIVFLSLEQGARLILWTRGILAPLFFGVSYLVLVLSTTTTSNQPHLDHRANVNMDFEARPEKRRRLDELQDLNSSHTEEPTGRPISPPTLRRGLKVDEAITAHNLDMRSIPSPIRLSRIRDAPTNDNIDAVRLHDLVGSPLVKECWHFNFLFDVDFVMYAMRSFSIV